MKTPTLREWDEQRAKELAQSTTAINQMWACLFATGIAVFFALEALKHFNVI